jgi:hypothetical protein
MSADLWLVGSQDLHKKTDTYLVVTHEVEQPESGVVSQCAKE